MQNRDLFGVIEDHAGGVVDSNHHLVLSLTGLNSPQPELVLPEVTGYVLNHTAHARSFAGTKATSVRNINRYQLYCI